MRFTIWDSSWTTVLQTVPRDFGRIQTGITILAGFSEMVVLVVEVDVVVDVVDVVDGESTC